MSENLRLTTQARIGAGYADFAPFELDGRFGVIIRPRANHIPVGQEGEPIEDFAAGDVVLWVDGPPTVLLEALALATAGRVE